MLGGTIGRYVVGEIPSTSSVRFSAETGAFVVTGTSVQFTAFEGGTGSFAVTGSDVVLSVSMAADVGSFAVDGGASTQLPAAYRLLCSPKLASQKAKWGFSPVGSFVVGQIEGSEGGTVTFNVVGYDLEADFSITAATGTFSVAGQSVSLVEGNILTADAAQIIATWRDAGLLLVMPASAGAVTITGGTSTTDLTRRAPKLRRFPRVGSTTVSARSRGAGVKVRAYGG